MENLFYLIPIALILYFGLFVVNQQTTAIVERFGKFTSIRQSGLNLKSLWWIKFRGVSV